MSISYYRIYLEELIPKLRRFFEERSDVLMAIIFGSSLKRSLVRDLDIAALLERRLDLMSLCKLIARLEELTGVPVDLAPLDEAPPAIVLKALQEGRIIFARDKQIYPELLKRAIAEATDLEIKNKDMKRRKDPN
ncbi:MAG: nucleotidyltransferase domain-containing protein [Thaumarchaeota archaeon]|nr:nucleotidyltransferase domain-containing protein [Nitrososphaerota archaeon]